MTRTVQGGGRLCKRDCGNPNLPTAPVVAPGAVSWTLIDTGASDAGIAGQDEKKVALAPATGAAAMLALTALFKQGARPAPNTLDRSDKPMLLASG